ncbi:Uncharacterised protein [Legionella wadsworthii]|uniref:Uncharacterized protein n=1 Tax=Legionella wadsworthii TaxID=28088 RepID=A0A378LYJ3_9GAMM|nr:hypothetical protein [Legionella wadsworthii]STY29131.1 Uncharacterised protein [Legionella wadsworthii]
MNIEKAKLIWREFYQKYSFKEIEIARSYLDKQAAADFMQLIQSKHGAEKVEQAATVIQNVWRKAKHRNLLNISRKGNHRYEFLHLLHQENVKKSLNSVLLEELQKALDLGDWSAPVFSHSRYLYAAMTLFDQKKITQQQMYTLLERDQTLKDYPLINTYAILNEEGDWTDEARDIMLKSLPSLSEDQLNLLRHLILQLPKSEQMFYTTEMGGFNPNSNQKTLMGLLYQQKSIYSDGNHFINLAAGIHDALGLTQYGVNEYVRPMMRLGKQSIDDIEEGVRFQSRYTAAIFPGAFKSKSVHEYENLTAKEVTEHDRYHSKIMSKIPKDILHTFWEMIDLSRQTTGIKWSREIWNWIDMATEYFITSDDILNEQAYQRYLNYKKEYKERYGTHPPTLDAVEEDILQREDLSPEELDTILSGFMFERTVLSEEELYELCAESFLFINGELNIGSREKFFQFLDKVYDRRLEKDNALHQQIMEIFDCKMTGKPLPAHNSKTQKSMTALFCKIVRFGTDSINTESHGFYMFYKNKINLMGILFLLDLLNHPEKYETFHIFADELISPFKKYFESLKEISPFLQNHDIKIQLLKCHLYFNLQEDLFDAISDSEFRKVWDKFKDINEYIDSNEHSIIETLTFKKVDMESEDSAIPNSIALYYEDMPLIPAKIKDLTNQFLEHQFSQRTSTILPSS